MRVGEDRWNLCKKKIGSYEAVLNDLQYISCFLFGVKGRKSKRMDSMFEFIKS